MNAEPDSPQELLLQIHDLSLRLEEAQETLQAIRMGAVDAVVVSDGENERIYTLRSADSIYRVLIEALNEGALTLTSDGTIMYCNARFAEMIHLPLEKVTGTSFERFVFEQDRWLFRALVENSRAECRAEMLLKTPNGTNVPVLVSLSEAKAEEARGLRILVVTDLTELRQAQQALKKANEELEARVAERTEELAIANEELRAEIGERRAAEEQAEELNRVLQLADTRKNEFLAMLAHELRTPLSAISGAVQFLRMRGPDDAKLTRAKDAAERQVKHMARLLDDLLDISRITNGKIDLHKERLEVMATVNMALEMVNPLMLERRHTVTLHSFPGPVYVEADRDRLMQMIANLLNNAARYSPPSGRIHVSVGIEGTFAAIRVIDNGIGIPADILPRIFDLFMRADHIVNRSERGLGIGLTLARRLAEMHGGSVSAHSEGEGKGSEFVIHLPWAPPPASSS